MRSGPVIHQNHVVEIRAAGDGSNQYDFTAATERKVDTPYGPEVLRMSGVQLKRFRSNPVVLDTHNRSEVGAVVGRATMKREGGQLAARIQFANTPRAQVARQLVDDGFVRAVSVGFIPRNVRQVRKGEVDGDVEGPARIVTQWELIELSLVPVPADAEALARSHYFGPEGQESDCMKFADLSGEQPAAPEVPAVEPAPTPEPAQRSQAVEPTPEPAPTVEPTDNEINLREQRALIEARRDIDGEIQRLGEIAGCVEQARDLIVAGATLAQARKVFAKAMAERSQPVGTPEPQSDNPSNPEPEAREVTVDQLRDGLKRL